MLRYGEIRDPYRRQYWKPYRKPITATMKLHNHETQYLRRKRDTTLALKLNSYFHMSVLQYLDLEQTNCVS